MTAEKRRIVTVSILIICSLVTGFATGISIERHRYDDEKAVYQRLFHQAVNISADYQSNYNQGVVDGGNEACKKNGVTNQLWFLGETNKVWIETIYPHSNSNRDKITTIKTP